MHSPQGGKAGRKDTEDTHWLEAGTERILSALSLWNSLPGVGPAEVGDLRDGGYLEAQQESGYPKGKSGVQGEKVGGRRLEGCLP